MSQLFPVCVASLLVVHPQIWLLVRLQVRAVGDVSRRQGNVASNHLLSLNTHVRKNNAMNRKETLFNDR